MRIRFHILPVVVFSLAAVVGLPQSGSAAIHPVALQDAEKVSIPDTPVGKRFAAFIATCTEGDAEKIHAMAADFFLDQDEESVRRRRGQFAAAQSRLGEAKPLRIESSSDYSLIIVLAVNGGEATFSVTVEEQEPHRIDHLSIAARPAGENSAAANAPLTAEDRQAILEESAQQLEEKYVFPEVGDKMAAHLREGLKSGKYDEIDDPMTLATQLTEELRDICHDRHLGLRPAAPPTNGSGRLMRESINHGFVKAEILPGNIGYIKFNAFEPTVEAKRVAAAAMEFVREADALIFDVRENGGGSPEMIVCLTSYLFDEPTHLNSFYNRATDETTETWTTKDTPERKFRADMPVYVLTSSYTFSAAEEFTYNLQCLKRATIVGETTGGGAHPVRGEFVGGRMQLRVPFARAINPITNTNWEGTGITPDIECSALDALDTATEHAKAQREE